MSNVTRFPSRPKPVVPVAVIFSEKWVWSGLRKVLLPDVGSVTYMVRLDWHDGPANDA